MFKVVAGTGIIDANEQLLLGVVQGLGAVNFPKDDYAAEKRKVYDSEEDFIKQM